VKSNTARQRQRSIRDVTDEMVSLVGVRKALRANADKLIDEHRPIDAAKLLDEADGYTARINTLLDRYLDERSDLKEAA